MDGIRNKDDNIHQVFKSDLGRVKNQQLVLNTLCGYY